MYSNLLFREYLMYDVKRIGRNLYCLLPTPFLSNPILPNRTEQKHKNNTLSIDRQQPIEIEEGGVTP